MSAPLKLGTPRRVEILASRGKYFKPGQYGYVISEIRKGGMFFQDVDRSSNDGEVAYLVTKSKHGRGGALWYSAAGLRFTGTKKAKRTKTSRTKAKRTKGVKRRTLTRLRRVRVGAGRRGFGVMRHNSRVIPSSSSKLIRVGTKGMGPLSSLLKRKAASIGGGLELVWLPVNQAWAFFWFGQRVAGPFSHEHEVASFLERF